uniref:Uncharacterized protein n=1 Tax=uncultured Methanosarcinales archaeon TaxID=183757 RepID=A0A7H1KNQ3_9EURY|nr:hypothetical protein HCAOCCDF_00015 [uncultured Methanosarcinales archaeon]
MDEWQVDLNMPDIGGMFTMGMTGICSTLIGIAEIAYMMMILTTAYETNGKDWLLELLYAEAYTEEITYVLVASILLLVSAIVFLLTTSITLIELYMIRKGRSPHIKTVFTMFLLGLVLLALTMVSTIVIKQYGVEMFGLIR